ncbi:MAG: hypothetical protein KCHDKBKB_03083 [Elusimicrobia bacterium]|nr:hypothetical protein [Elusimicrobiota bacterium]
MRTWFLRISNLALYLSFCVMTGTGFLIAYRLPPGHRGRLGLTVMGMKGHEWSNIHFYASWVFIGLIGLHLILHWHWLVRVAGQNSKKMLWLGLGVGVLIILGLLILP